MAQTPSPGSKNQLLSTSPAANPQQLLCPPPSAALLNRTNNSTQHQQQGYPSIDEGACEKLQSARATPPTSVSFHSSTKLDDDDGTSSSQNRTPPSDGSSSRLPTDDQHRPPRPYRPRLDSHGRPIRRGSKKHSIAFVDEIKSSENIEKVYEVESYKGTGAYSRTRGCFGGCSVM